VAAIRITVMAAMPLGERTRRLGALPAEAYNCFMVGTLYGFNRIQAWFALREIALSYAVDHSTISRLKARHAAEMI